MHHTHRLPHFGAAPIHQKMKKQKGYVPLEAARATWLSALFTTLGWIVSLALPLIINPLFFLGGFVFGLRGALGVLRYEPISWVRFAIAGVSLVLSITGTIAFVTGWLKLA